MDKFTIQGPTPLRGTIPISGSKNAALPLMAAALLADGPTVITHVPKLKDIYTFNNVLRVTGTHVQFDGLANRLIIDPSHLAHIEAPYDLVRKMRASFYMLGSLVGRTGQARVSLPGGCAWGPRPVDLHLKGLEAMGVQLDLDGGYVVAKTGKTLPKTEFTLNPSSVGATINLLLAAVLRSEQFTIRNAAKEPDVVQLCEALLKMGADIEGAGTDTLTIRRVGKLKAVPLRNSPDRIETGTFMIAAAMHPESDLLLTDTNPEDLGVFSETLSQTGAIIETAPDRIRVQAPESIRPVSIETAIYPGFPTDLQAQWSTMMTQAEGRSTVTDAIYMDRFSYVPELKRLGANMSVYGNKVSIEGPNRLSGASVMSTDLRASVSLVLAGMVSRGETNVLRIYHLDRGYEDLEQKLNRVGASIQRSEDPPEPAAS
ncbi:MAG: UDP-N-acetylglucosamine 1-carboxyvinyltransferase [Balneolaceae bacterium]